MGIETLYKEVMELNMMADNAKRKLPPRLFSKN
jgi:hypothetical protein